MFESSSDGGDLGFGEKKDLILFFAVLIAHFDALVTVTAPMIERAPMVKTKHGCHLLGSVFLKNIIVHLSFALFWPRRGMDMRGNI